MPDVCIAFDKSVPCDYNGTVDRCLHRVCADRFVKSKMIKRNKIFEAFKRSQRKKKPARLFSKFKNIRSTISRSHGTPDPPPQRSARRHRSGHPSREDIGFTTIEDLIIQKVIAGRPRDMEDVKNVVIKHESFDKAYITKWLSDFSDHLGEPFLDRFNSLCKEVE